MRREIRHAAGAVLATAAAALCGSGLALATPTVGEISALLEQRAVSYDKAQAQRAAVGALIRAEDPAAKILSKAEAAQLESVLNGTAERRCGEGGAAPVSYTNATPRTLDSLELWPEGIAYLKIRGLYLGSGSELLSHLRALSGSWPGLILDLRGADGCDLASAADLASPFRGAGNALFKILDGRDQTVQTQLSAETPPLRFLVMMLVDRDTTCAAELLAGLLSGCPNVMLIGAPTRGDPRLRELVPLTDGEVLYVATRRIVMGDGRSYGKTGIRPDVVVAAEASAAGFTGNVSSNAPAARRPASERSGLSSRVAGDPILRRATDILVGLQALGVHGSR